MEPIRDHLSDTSTGKEECKHVPDDNGNGYVGKVCKCALCGVELVYNNRPAGAKVRLSKKERRKLKEAAKPVAVETKGEKIGE